MGVGLFWLVEEEEGDLFEKTPKLLTPHRMCSCCLSPLPKLDQLNVLNLKGEELSLLLIG